MRKLFVCIFILLVLNNPSYADYAIDESNRMITDNKIRGTNAEVLEVPYEGNLSTQAIKKAIDYIDLEFDFDFEVHIVDYMYFYNQQLVLGTSIVDENIIILFNCLYIDMNEYYQATITHEIGHLIYHSLSKEEKEIYRKIRQIPNYWDNKTSIYIEKPHEIFADDFRLLFGIEGAKSYPHLNQNIINVYEVKGLKDFFTNLKGVNMSKCINERI